MYWQLLVLVLLNLSGVYCNQCACVTHNKNIQSGPWTSSSVLGTISKTTCLPYLGVTQGAQGYTWRKVKYRNETAWMGGSYINIQTCPAGMCLNVVSRSEWGARAPKSTPKQMSATPENVFIHHGESASCSTQSTCAAKVRAYQNYHMNTKGWNDIGYSFLVGEDGQVYEGRGWMVAGAHTSGYNNVGYGFSVIGDYASTPPNSAAQTALQDLIACGVGNGNILSGYRLLGHRDVVSTNCPGQSLYSVIQEWPNYNSTPL